MISDNCHVPLALSAGTCISLTTEEVVDRVDGRRVNGSLRFWGVDSGTEPVLVWGVWFVERTGVRGSSITFYPRHPHVILLTRLLIHAYRAWTTRARRSSVRSSSQRYGDREPRRPGSPILRRNDAAITFILHGLKLASTDVLQEPRRPMGLCTRITV